MRIAQILLPGASEYERKSRRVDAAALAAEHEVELLDPGEVTPACADVAHVYAGGPLPPRLFAGFPVPFVATADVARRRWSFRPRAEPDLVVSPLFEPGGGGREQLLPEAVEDAWFRWEAESGGGRPEEREVRRVGSFRRPGTEALVDQVRARLARTREDVLWVEIERAPAPEDLASFDLWADPATAPDDLDGFVAEAIVAGVPVVASRNRINELRLEHGRCGQLVRPRDPNEWTHAILAGLFKSELTAPKLRAARQTRSKFQGSQRVRVLSRMYQTLTR